MAFWPLGVTMLQPWNRETLKKEFASAKPVSFVKIDNFLVPEIAAEIAIAYPPFELAQQVGKTFSSVNERRKVQITDASKFPPAVQRLYELLSSPAFLSDLSYITGLPSVFADEQLLGGGIHMTGPGGRLDVHVDFNYIEDRRLHRRLNLLLYLNPTWQSRWGGQFQLWDAEVKHCVETFDPIFNRCVIFETNEISFHGVIPVSPDAPVPRKSFATYYYTEEAPAHWNGLRHSTLFVARPDEGFKKYIGMPSETLIVALGRKTRSIKKTVKNLIG
jgi:2OG-Fe(II) oxygenase superfamily